MARARRLPNVENVRDLIAHLGDVPPERIRMHPPPGTATEKDLLRLIEKTGVVCELIDGVLVEKAVGYREEVIGPWVGHLIQCFLDSNKLGFIAGAAAATRLMPGMVRIPDVAFVRWEKTPDRCIPDEPIPDLVPDLAVEVLSEGNTPGEMRRKRREYFLAGVSLVWLVDAKKRTVTAFTPTNAEGGITLTEADTLDGGDVLAGFRLPVARIFENLRKPSGDTKPRRKKGA